MRGLRRAPRRSSCPRACRFRMPCMCRKWPPPPSSNIVEGEVSWALTSKEVDSRAALGGAAVDRPDGRESDEPRAIERPYALGLLRHRDDRPGDLLPLAILDQRVER